MRILALLLLLVANPAFAQDSLLIGTWKLVAFENRVDNEPPISSWERARRAISSSRARAA